MRVLKRQQLESQVFLLDLDMILPYSALCRQAICAEDRTSTWSQAELNGTLLQHLEIGRRMGRRDRLAIPRQDQVGPQNVWHFTVDCECLAPGPALSFYLSIFLFFYLSIFLSLSLSLPLSLSLCVYTLAIWLLLICSLSDPGD